MHFTSTYNTSLQQVTTSLKRLVVENFCLQKERKSKWRKAIHRGMPEEVSWIKFVVERMRDRDGLYKADSCFDMFTKCPDSHTWKDTAFIENQLAT